MFGNNNNQNNEISKLLTEMKKDLASLAHKTGTLDSNIKDIYQVVYKDADSIQNRLLIISNRLQSIAQEQNATKQKADNNENRIDKLERALSIIVRQSEGLDKIKSQILIAIVSFVVPIALGGLFLGFANNNEPESRQVIIDER